MASTIEQEIAHDLPILRADERRVRQILLNLLSNAVKFTPRGGIVRLIAFVDEREFVVQVADTGIGIAPRKTSRAPWSASASSTATSTANTKAPASACR